MSTFGNLLKSESICTVGVWTEVICISKNNTSPKSLTCPIGAWWVETKASVRVLCCFCTARAAWILPNIHAITGFLRECALTAIEIALRKLCGPSALASSALRIAPVSTMGLPWVFFWDKEASKKNAVSSKVSVPCTKTTPATPSSAQAAMMARRVCNQISDVRWADATLHNCSVDMLAIFSNCGIACSNSSPELAGTSKPSALVRMAMVPPVKMM